MKVTIVLVAATMACTQLTQATPVKLDGVTCANGLHVCNGPDWREEQQFIEWQKKQKNPPVKKDHDNKKDDDKLGVGLFGIPSSVWHDRLFQTLVKGAYRQFLSNKQPVIKVDPYRRLLDPHGNKIVYDGHLHLDRRSTQDDAATDVAMN